MTREDWAQCPKALRDFLSYHEVIAGHSAKTVSEYFLDMRLFFRFLLQNRGQSDPGADFDEIPILGVDLAFLKDVTLSEVYDYLSFLSRERPKQPSSARTGYGLGAAARARKVASIRSFFKYLTQKAHLLDKNPVADLDSPRQKKTLPRYLNEQESRRLLSCVEGRHAARDYAVMTLFLNCGLRRSELANLNLADVRGDHIRVTGKGGKDRVLYLGDACIAALGEYMEARPETPGQTALFLSGQGKRMHPNTIHALVKKHLAAAGLDPARYSAHKLRHTAATLMLGGGVDVRTLQEVLGHEHLNTTQIYTHVDNAELRLAARANPLSKVKTGKKTDNSEQ